MLHIFPFKTTLLSTLDQAQLPSRTSHFLLSAYPKNVVKLPGEHLGLYKLQIKDRQEFTHSMTSHFHMSSLRARAFSYSPCIKRV